MNVLATLLFALAVATAANGISFHRGLPVQHCGHKWGCAALPNATCLSSRNGADCTTLFTYERSLDPHHRGQYYFRLFQRQPLNDSLDGFWAAVGLSNDNNTMPNTSMVECRIDYNTWPMQFSLQTAYATNFTRPDLREIKAVHPALYRYSAGGLMSCRFYIEKIMSARGEATQVDLSKPTFLLLAHGRIRNDLLLHHDNQGATANAVNLGQYPKSQ